MVTDRGKHASAFVCDTASCMPIFDLLQATTCIPLLSVNTDIIAGIQPVQHWCFTEVQGSGQWHIEPPGTRLELAAAHMQAQERRRGHSSRAATRSKPQRPGPG